MLRLEPTAGNTASTVAWRDSSNKAHGCANGRKPSLLKPHGERLFAPPLMGHLMDYGIDGPELSESHLVVSVVSRDYGII